MGVLKRWVVGSLAATAVVGAGSTAWAATTIEFWNAYSQSEEDALVKQVLPLFEKEHPDIHVVARNFSYDQLRDKLAVGAAAGSGADVARIDIIWSPQFAEKDLLVPLDKLPGFDATKAKLFPGPLRTNVWRGATYGLPLDTNTQVMLINQNVLNQAGVTVPTTLDQWSAATRHLTQRTSDKTTRWGYALPGPYSWYFLPWLWSNGGNVTDDAITQATGYLDSTATVGAVELLKQLYDEGAISPTAVGGKAIGTYEGLEQGVYAATQDGPWAVKSIQEKLSGLQQTVFPAGAGGSISVVGGENIGIFKTTKSVDASWTFAQFMLSTEAQTIMAEAGQMPVVKDALRFPGMQSLYSAYLQQLLTARPRTVHPTWDRIDGILNKAFKDSMTGQAAPSSAFASAAKQVDALLAGGN
ncbi:MAG TPA: extracellular solute-binding protein [Limnochordia bacterium]|nr:extracellular solute-binding protein [Limnochordia bacterium]